MCGTPQHELQVQVSLLAWCYKSGYEIQSLKARILNNFRTSKCHTTKKKKVQLSLALAELLSSDNHGKSSLSLSLSLLSVRPTYLESGALEYGD